MQTLLTTNAQSTLMQFRLKIETHIFLSILAFCPHRDSENALQSERFKNGFHIVVWTRNINVLKTVTGFGHVIWSKCFVALQFNCVRTEDCI